MTLLRFFVLFLFFIASESADDITSHDVETCKGRSEPIAAGTGIDHANVSAEGTVDGDVFGTVRVSEEKYIGSLLNGMVGSALVFAFYTVLVTVHQHEFESAGVYDFFINRVHALFMGGESVVAVAVDIIESQRGIILFKIVELAHTVAEEENTVDFSVFEVLFDDRFDAVSFAVGIGEYKNFHFILQFCVNRSVSA